MPLVHVCVTNLPSYWSHPVAVWQGMCGRVVRRQLTRILADNDRNDFGDVRHVLSRHVLLHHSRRRWQVPASAEVY